MVAYHGRRLSEAVSALDSAINLDPLMDIAYAVRALAKSRLGDQVGALNDAQAARRVAEDPVFAEATLAVVEVAKGDTAAGRARTEALVAASLRQRSVTVEEGVWVAYALAAVGDHRLAIEVLDRVQPRGGHLFLDMRSPHFDALRRDPRFHRIAAEARPPDARSGNAPTRRASRFR